MTETRALALLKDGAFKEIEEKLTSRIDSTIADQFAKMDGRIDGKLSEIMDAFHLFTSKGKGVDSPSHSAQAQGDQLSGFVELH